MTTFSIDTLGYIRSCFPEKFGIPRQPLLAPSATAQLRLQAPYNHPDCVAGLEQSSHVWLTFVFHQHLDQAWKPKVRPPRLGGNKKYGVFASRSSFRPNPLGLSVVKLEKITAIDQQVVLHLSGVDLLDGTPVVDIKPYIPYADKVDDASNDFAAQAPTLLAVVFSPQASEYCDCYRVEERIDTSKRLSVGNIRQLITEVLQQDPRPAYQQDENRIYKMSLLEMAIEWRCCLLNKSQVIEVLTIK